MLAALAVVAMTRWPIVETAAASIRVGTSALASAPVLAATTSPLAAPAAFRATTDLGTVAAAAAGSGSGPGSVSGGWKVQLPIVDLVLDNQPAAPKFIRAAAILGALCVFEV
jgi:hypothetical protein